MPKDNRKIICNDIFGKKTTVTIDQLSFRPSVYGIIMHKNKVLLSKQWGCYDFPGGGIELGETINEALKREVQEETGLEIEVGAIVTCENSFFEIPFKKKFIQSIMIYYLCNVIGGDISKEGFDEYEKKCADLPEWFDLKNVDDIKFIHNSVDRKIILKKAIDLNKIKKRNKFN